MVLPPSYTVRLVRKPQLYTYRWVRKTLGSFAELLSHKRLSRPRTVTLCTSCCHDLYLTYWMCTNLRTETKVNISKSCGVVYVRSSLQGLSATSCSYTHQDDLGSVISYKETQQPLSV